MSKTAVDYKGMDYTKKVELLESYIGKLQSEDVSLEEAVSLYKQGIELSEICRKEIEDAKGQIKIIGESREA